MKKFSKRLISVLLASSMVAVAFAGCQQGGTQSSSGSSSTTSSGSTSSSTAENTGALYTGKWDGDVTKVTYYIGNSNPWGDWRNTFLKDAIGVEVEISVGDNDKLAGMLSSGSLPDIGLFAQNGTVEQAVRGNMLVNLEEHMDALPDLEKNVKNVLQYSKEQMSYGQDGIFAVPTAVGPADDYAVDTTTYAFNIRWDIYREAGYPEVKNFDEALDALKKMLEVHPKADDGVAMNAFELSNEGDKGANEAPFDNIQRYFRMTGVKSVRGFLEYDIRAEKLQPILSKDSRWYEGMKWWWKANQMGLISPESKTQKGGEIGPKLVQGGYTLTATPGSYYRGYNTNERVNADPPVGIYPLVFEGMYPTVPAVQDIGSVGNSIAISKATSNLDACLRLLNIFYNEDACITLYNSPQGELWDLVDGEIHATDDYTDFYNNSEYTLKNGEVLKTGAFFFSFGLHTDWHHTKYGVTMRQSEWPDAIELMSDNNLIREWSEHNGTMNGKKYAYPSEMYKAEDLLTWEPSACLFTKAYDDQIAVTATSIGDQIATYGWQMVYASTEAEFDRLFDELVQKAESLGLKECEEWGKQMWADAEAMADKYIGE